MEVIMRRLKDGRNECGEPTIRHMNIVEAIAYVIPNEMQWGAKWEWEGESLVFKTRVFGDLDITTMKGTLDEVSTVHASVMAYTAGKTKEVTYRLLQRMNLPYNRQTIYSFEDTIVVLEMFLNGEDVSEAICLIKQKQPEPLVVTKEKLEEVHDLKKKMDLSPNDGVNCVLANFLGI